MGLRKFIHQNILKMKKIYYLTLAAMLAGASATGMASAKKSAHWLRLTHSLRLSLKSRAH